ncbi:VanW family protein [Patescibacteria group bacterium]|nr:VanW family protein [Patescibacteria group bacterium]
MTLLSPKKKKTNEDANGKPKRKLTRAMKWLLSVVGFVVLLLAAGTAYAFYYHDRMVPRTYIAGVAVGGMTKTEAANAITAKENQFKNSTLHLTYQEKSWQFRVSDLDLQFLNSDGLNQAYSRGKVGSISDQLNQMFSALLAPVYYEVDLNPLPDGGRKNLEDKAVSSIETAPAETTLDFVPGAVRIIPGKAGEKMDENRFESDLYQSFRDQDPTIALQLKRFNPEVSADQAVAAQQQASRILSSDWTVQTGSKALTLKATDIAGMLTTSVARDSTGTATGLQIGVNDDALQKVVTDVAKQVSVDPKNAVLNWSNNSIQVTQDGVAGSMMIIDQTIQTIKQQFANSPQNHTVQASMAVVQPYVTKDNLASLGITQQIGTATTDFTGSPTNRTFNIGLGEKTINGSVIKDGDTFSTVKTLGPIDEAHGYLPELVILDNKTLPEPGGGLCQVSTTLFRAVLNAGLPVVSRTNHAYRVRYYETGVGPGLDATVYDPQPDFMWKNDTGHAIYIQGSIKDKKLTFDLYGTADGRTVNIDGPHTLQTFQPSSTPQYVNTDTLAKGVTELIDPPVPGARTTATYTVTRNGQVINKQTFNSYYTAMPAQYLVGTK